MSLAGIILMIGHKLRLVRAGQTAEPEHPHAFVPDFQKMRKKIFQNAKEYEHLTLVVIIRLYVRSVNITKSGYQNLKTKIQNIRAKRKESGDPEEKQEVSKFLKMISEYKDKIRHLKHQIKEEEENK